MVLSRFRWVGWAWGMWAATSGALGAGKWPAWTMPEPTAALRQAAAARDLPVEGRDLTGRERLSPGDRVVLLVDLTEDGKVTQWLVDFVVAAPNAEEAALPEARGARVFTSTGRSFDFAGERVIMEVNTVGPVRAAARDAEKEARRAKDQRARLGVNGRFLQIGFARHAEAAARISVRAKVLTAEDRKVTYQISGQEPPPEVVAAMAPVAEKLDLTEADEEAMAGMAPALQEFVGIIARTAGLRDVFAEVVDVPWWSIVSRGGKMPEIGFGRTGERNRVITADEWAEAEGRGMVHAVAFMLTLNGKPALKFELAAVMPEAPETAVAGVIGLVAAPPENDKKALRVRVLATRAASEKSSGEGGGKE